MGTKLGKQFSIIIFFLGIFLLATVLAKEDRAVRDLGSCRSKLENVALTTAAR